MPFKLVVLLTMAREREAKITDLDAKIKDAEREKRTDLVETYKSALSLIDKDSGSMYDSLATLLSTAIQKDGKSPRGITVHYLTLSRYRACLVE